MSWQLRQRGQPHLKRHSSGASCRGALLGVMRRPPRQEQHLRATNVGLGAQQQSYGRDQVRRAQCLSKALASVVWEGDTRTNSRRCQRRSRCSIGQELKSPSSSSGYATCLICRWHGAVLVTKHGHVLCSRLDCCVSPAAKTCACVCAG